MGPDLTWGGHSWALDREHVHSKASRVRSDDDARDIGDALVRTE